MFKVVITEVTGKEKMLKVYQKLHDKEEFITKDDPQYGYVEVKGVDNEVREIYTQEVDQLDLVKVIQAVNTQKEVKI